MQGDKIQALNMAIRETIQYLQEAADACLWFDDVLVRALQFSNGARWHILHPTPVSDLTWANLKSDRSTERDMGAALWMVANKLQIPPMPERALAPVLVLISGGKPTDDFAGGVRALMDQPWGKKAVRVAMAIGQDADHEVLQRFIGHAELKPLQANNPEALVSRIRCLLGVVLPTSPQPSRPSGSAATELDVPMPQPIVVDVGPSTMEDVW